MNKLYTAKAKSSHEDARINTCFVCSIAKAHTYTYAKDVFFGGKIATSAKCERELKWSKEKPARKKRRHRIEKNSTKWRKKQRSHTQHKPSNKLLLLFWYLANVNRALVRFYICVCVRAASIQYHSFAYIHKKRTQFNRWLLFDWNSNFTF